MISYDPFNSPQPAPESETECECEFHTMIHPISGNYPLCIYNDNPELFSDSKGGSTHLVPKQQYQDHNGEIVMEDGDFFIEKNPDGDTKGYDKHESWIMHYCSSVYWKTYVDEYYMTEYGKCAKCDQTIPPGLIALWKLHNWEYLQSGGGTATEFDTQLAETTCA